MKITPITQTTLIPFGKYKGQPIEVLSQDPDYVRWLTEQDWFRSRHAPIFNLIVNNLQAPVDTPEHNKLQLQFMKTNVVTLALCASGAHNERAHSWGVHSLEFEESGFDVAISYFHRFVNAKICRTCGYEPSKHHKFEARDACKPGYEYCKCGYKKDNELSYGHQHHEFISSFDIRYSTALVELKPSISDDFPSVLRQVKSSKAYREGFVTLSDGEKERASPFIVICNEFSSETGWRAVRSMFWLSNIHLFRLRNLLRRPMPKLRCKI